MEKEFIEFLKKNNAFKEFSNDIKRLNSAYDNINELCINKDPRDYFYSAFVWSKSAYGREFWRDLNRKWLKEIEK